MALERWRRLAVASGEAFEGQRPAGCNPEKPGLSFSLDTSNPGNLKPE
jgi:hypothetical protein